MHGLLIGSSSKTKHHTRRLQCIKKVVRYTNRNIRLRKFEIVILPLFSNTHGKSRITAFNSEYLKWGDSEKTNEYDLFKFNLEMITSIIAIFLMASLRDPGSNAMVVGSPWETDDCIPSNIGLPKNRDSIP